MQPLQDGLNGTPHMDDGCSNASRFTYSNVSAASSTSSISSVTSPELQNATNDILLERHGRGLRWLREPSHGNGRRIRAAARNTRLSGLVNWLSGPSPPRIHTINSILPKVQTWPQRSLLAWLPLQSVTLVTITIFASWLIAFSMVLTISTQHSSALQPMRLACETRLWPNTTFCGLDGKACEPFDEAAFTFSCPSNCISVQVLEPHTIGNQEIVYRSMVIGGPSPSDESILAVYRGDSFICASAIHAGVFSNDDGGCGILSRQGEHRRFSGSKRNGISSIEFLPSFPLSFSLTGAGATCADPQWQLFTISVVASVLISMLTVSSSVFCATIFVIVFFQVALASDPPFFPDFSSVLSMAFERGLPTAFVAWFLYRYCIRHTLQGLQAHLERTILWLGGCWIGALNNYTFDQIPISRLTGHDLRQQPGAITALIIIVLLIAAIAAGQAWAFRKERRLLHYLGLYLGIGVAIGCLAAIPGLQLRLHHYIIALLLLPGTSLQTRPSLLYQGILFGLFINGIARWGYASILQTAEVLREDGQLGSALPQVLEPVLQSQSISFTMPALTSGFDGISVLVNDVERFRGSGSLLQSMFNWTRTSIDDPVFFRFAFVGTNPLGGIWHGDYTKPGTWYPNGTWEHPAQGTNR